MSGQKQAEWRTDPKRSGAGGAVGDIGTHAYNLADLSIGLGAQSSAAELTSFGAGRKLDDNAQMMLRYGNGARGTIWASQVAPGNENRLQSARLRNEGRAPVGAGRSELSLWTPLGEPKRLVTRGGAGSGEAAARVTRMPAGHPEGYLEGFANIYREVALAIKAARVWLSAAQGRPFPDRRGRRQGPRIVRGGGQFIEGQRQVGEAVRPRSADGHGRPPIRPALSRAIPKARRQRCASLAATQSCQWHKCGFLCFGGTQASSKRPG